MLCGEIFEMVVVTDTQNGSPRIPAILKTARSATLGLLRPDLERWRPWLGVLGLDILHVEKYSTAHIAFQRQTSQARRVGGHGENGWRVILRKDKKR